MGQRSGLFDLPSHDASMLRHYTLTDDDLEHINARRRSKNRIGFALQFCAVRFPGRLLSSEEIIPEEVLRFIAAQLGLTGDDILPYAAPPNPPTAFARPSSDLLLQNVCWPRRAPSQGAA